MNYGEDDKTGDYKVVGSSVLYKNPNSVFAKDWCTIGTIKNGLFYRHRPKGFPSWREKRGMTESLDRVQSLAALWLLENGHIDLDALQRRPTMETTK